MNNYQCRFIKEYANHKTRRFKAVVNDNTAAQCQRELAKAGIEGVRAVLRAVYTGFITVDEAMRLLAEL